MRRKFIRYVSVGTVVVALAAAMGVAALAASSNRGHQFGPRGGLTIHGFGPGFGFAFGFPGGPGLGVRVGGGGVTYADVLTPAADYLNVSLSTLQSDLKGGKTLAQEAAAKNKTASGLIDAIVAAETKVLDAQKAAGWLTDAQETALLDNFKDQVTDLVNNGPGVPRVGIKTDGPLQTAADYLGISVSDLMADLKAGKTLAQEATAKGKTVDGLVDAMLAPLKTKLDKSVSAGDITAAQETTILNNAKTALTNLANNMKPDKVQAGLRQAGLGLALPRLFFLHR
jgi:D-Tyr-tRNAtyr deacylase